MFVILCNKFIIKTWTASKSCSCQFSVWVVRLHSSVIYCEFMPQKSHINRISIYIYMISVYYNHSEIIWPRLNVNFWRSSFNIYANTDECNHLKSIMKFTAGWAFHKSSVQRIFSYMTYNLLNWTTTQNITARSQQVEKKKHHKKLVTWYIKFSFKKTLKTDFYIIKWMKRKAANRCRSPLALHMTLHTHVENSSKHNHNHTFSLFSVSYSSMLHILITRHKNKQTFSLTVGFSTIIIVDI